MKVAVIGSRGITKCDLASYLPENTDEIVSGGAKGIDTCAREYANKNGISIIGDIPIYVSFDSCDVWKNPNLFQTFPSFHQFPHYI